METIVGVGLPVLLLIAFELYYQLNSIQGPDYMVAAPETPNTQTLAEHTASQQQNVFGVKVIAISMAVIGVGIIALGVLAPSFSGVVIGVGLFILIMAAIIWYKIKPKPAVEPRAAKRTAD
jgi:SSS family solute:Na+ symporter